MAVGGLLVALGALTLVGFVAALRAAIDVVAWNGSDGAGTSLAGRSLQEIERRVDELTLLVGAGWVVTILAAAVAAFAGAYLWGTTGSDAPLPPPR